MKKILIASAFLLASVSAYAQPAPLQHYQPGFRLVNGSQLNLMVDQVNGLMGNGGTPGKGYFTANIANSGPTPSTGTVLQVVGANATIARTEVDAFGAAAAFSVRRADGTQATPTVIQSGDELGTYNFWGYNGTAYPANASARLSGYATENYSGTAHGGKIILSTTANTTLPLVDHVVLDQDGSLSNLSTSANALAVGANGVTTPALQVDASTASSITGIKIKSAASGGNIAITALGGTNESITIAGKGTGAVSLGSQLITTFGTPTIASGACGATTNGTVAGTNQAGQITIGSASTSTCIIAFSATLTAAPNSCVVFPASSGAAATGTTLAYVSSITSAHFVITGTLASTVYNYLCI